jgi:hypothetical protein
MLAARNLLSTYQHRVYMLSFVTGAYEREHIVRILNKHKGNKAEVVSDDKRIVVMRIVLLICHTSKIKLSPTLRNNCTR